ncbi:L,D-transpeptidase [Fulvimarina endophytica]|uniref:L,D-transpeptidase n=1 Tax=Fulvimarina endophytica TaxID=2293836 RepID=A0A371X5N0_9HYPH|nr:L,D-transpeptidase [Fulvimarina endophytica]RFC64542.1 L,D-transpeptidase [Fulvimarina endophytica]
MARDKTVRTALLLGSLALLTGCTTFEPAAPPIAYSAPAPTDPRYDAFFDDGRTLPAIPARYLTEENTRQLVAYDGPEQPGTIVVDPGAHFLYLVMEDGQAMRYRVGVGKAGYAFQGEATVARKAAWPRWTPTSNMIEREPERYGPHAGGLEGGLGNPLGARALYLYKNGRDTLYRIHGTNDPSSIGNSVSAGCIRMFNQDVIDLERRVPNGSRVVVRESEPLPEPFLVGALQETGT